MRLADKSRDRRKCRVVLAEIVLLSNRAVVGGRPDFRTGRGSNCREQSVRIRDGSNHARFECMAMPLSGFRIKFIFVIIVVIIPNTYSVLSYLAPTVTCMIVSMVPKTKAIVKNKRNVGTIGNACDCWHSTIV